MNLSLRSRAAMIAATMLGAIGMGGVSTTLPSQNVGTIAHERVGQPSANDAKSTPAKTVGGDRTLAQMFGSMLGKSNHRRNPGPGWSNRQVQRMARKKRNVKANRKNH